LVYTSIGNKFYLAIIIFFEMTNPIELNEIHNAQIKAFHHYLKKKAQVHIGEISAACRDFVEDKYVADNNFYIQHV